MVTNFVSADNFAASFDIILIFGKRTGDDNIGPNAEAAFDLDVGVAGAEVFYGAFDGRQKGIHRTRLAGAQPWIAGSDGLTPQHLGGFGPPLSRQNAF